MKFTQIIREAGVAGAGGAGFPAYAKHKPGAADTLVVNAAECDPLLYTDAQILRERLADVVAGAEIILEADGMKEAVIGMEPSRADMLGVSDGAPLSGRVRVRVLPAVYPIGDEISLIWQTTGRLVPPGRLPVAAGVVVHNVETVLNVFRACRDGAPVTHKWLTVSGRVDSPSVLCVPVGTPVAQLFSHLGITVAEDICVFDGGPAMGQRIDPASAVVKKTTNGLMLLPATSEAAMRVRRTPGSNYGRAITACCQCTRCTDMCPRHLLGYPLEPHRMVRAAATGKSDPVLVRTALLCCGCGVCESLACTQGISPRTINDGFKAALRRQNITFEPDPAVIYRPDRMRDVRLVPSARVKATLGVTAFDRRPTRVPDGWEPTEV
ncbi:MAG: 4Fe-4S dicluster domain-containing protein, partial [Clostridia bacterium]|nr:4Fe-4S dicluster domain-containing protein [Clostridia bacterium]